MITIIPRSEFYVTGYEIAECINDIFSYSDVLNESEISLYNLSSPSMQESIVENLVACEMVNEAKKVPTKEFSEQAVKAVEELYKKAKSSKGLNVVGVKDLETFYKQNDITSNELKEYLYHNVEELKQPKFLTDPQDKKAFKNFKQCYEILKTDKHNEQAIRGFQSFLPKLVEIVYDKVYTHSAKNSQTYSSDITAATTHIDKLKEIPLSHNITAILKNKLSTTTALAIITRVLQNPSLKDAKGEFLIPLEKQQKIINTINDCFKKINISTGKADSSKKSLWQRVKGAVKDAFGRGDKNQLHNRDYGPDAAEEELIKHGIK